MNCAPAQLLPWRIGQRVEWLAHGGVHAGRLTTWSGPSAAGVYVLTVSEAQGGAWVLVTLHAPGPTPPRSANQGGGPVCVAAA